MRNPEFWLRIGGILQLGVLLGSALVPKVMRWDDELKKLSPALQRLIWVYGVFISFTVAGLGTIALVFADRIASGAALGRAFAIFLLGFWGMRLAVQMFVYDVRAYLTNPLLKLGYFGLTATFTYLVVIYAAAVFIL